MKKGFTLIELLAVIVILAIIALIAVPIILNIIDDVNKNAFKETINGIVRQTESASVLEQITDEKLYKYENNAWVENKLEINGTHPKYIEVKINKEGKIRYAITDGSYCALKEYDGEVEVKKVPEEIKEQYCKLDVPQPTEEACFGYKITKNQVEITAYYEYKGKDKTNGECPSDVIIPSEIEGYKVTKIGNNAFKADISSRHRSVTSVIIPVGVTSIDDLAFYHQYSLKYVELPEGLIEIGYGAFLESRCPINAIPSSLKTIDSKAFRTCGLKSIELPEGLETIGSYAFYSTGLTNINIPSTVTSIGEYAFHNNSLTSVIIPDGITTIEQNVFSNNSLTSVIIPDSVTDIGEYAFNDNELSSIIIPDSVTDIGAGAFSLNKIRSIKYPKKITLGEGAFSNNELPDSDAYFYNITEGVIDYTTLNSYAGKNRNIIDIPSEQYGVKLTKIGARAFVNNYNRKSSKGITKVTIPSTVTSIGSSAFSYNKLTNIDIPQAVTSIGSSAFSNNNLTFVDIPEGITSIENSVFNSNQLTTVTIPNSVTSIGDSAFNYNKLISLEIPKNVTKIGSYAFYANDLATLVIPSNVEIIGNTSFCGNDLVNLTISEGVVDIQSGAFNSNKLKNIIIPSTVTNIGDHAFYGNPVETVTIKAKQGEIKLGSNAFWLSSNNDKIDWITD